MKISTIVATIALIGSFCGSFAQDAAENKELCNFLYQTYEAGDDSFIPNLQAYCCKSLDECRSALNTNQKELKAQISALSYKKVLFSAKNAKSTALMLSVVVGICIADLCMHKKLAQITADAADNLANSMHEGASFFMDGKVRIRPVYENRLASGGTLTVQERNAQVKENMGALRPFRGSWYSGDKVGLFTLTTFIKDLSEVIFYQEDMTYGSYLLVYQLVTKALAAGAVFNGLELIRDLKEIYKTKKELFSQYEQGERMLDLLAHA